MAQFVKRIEGSGARPSLTALFAVRFFKLNYYYFALRYLLDSGSFLFEVLVLNAVIHWTVRCRQMQCDKGRTILAAALLAPDVHTGNEILARVLGFRSCNDSTEITFEFGMVGFQRVTREVEAQNVLFFFHSSPFAPRRNFLNRHFVGRLFSEEAELVGCLFIFLSRLHDNVSIFKPLTAIRLNGIKDTGHRKDLNNLLRDELRAHPFDEIKGILERTVLVSFGLDGFCRSRTYTF